MSKLKVDELDTRSGSTITVAAGKTLAGTDIIDTAQITANAVDLTKLSDGTQGGTLYYGTAGAPTELAAGTSGKFLKTLGAGADPAWDDVPAGAPTGGGTDKIFFENEMTVDTDYTITANNNAMSAGTVTVVSGITVTLLGTSSWIIV